MNKKELEILENTLIIINNSRLIEIFFNEDQFEYLMILVKSLNNS